jgi:hypothetical protein
VQLGRRVNGRFQGYAPASGVSVQLDGPAIHQSVTTDSDGQYTFRALPAGRHTLSLTLPDGAQIREGTSDRIDVTIPIQGCPARHIFEVFPAPVAITISGTVTAPFGYSVANVPIWLAEEGQEPNFSQGEPIATTDSAGRFSVTATGPHVYVLTAVGAQPDRRPDLVIWGRVRVDALRTSDSITLPIGLQERNPTGWIFRMRTP